MIIHTKQYFFSYLPYRRQFFFWIFRLERLSNSLDFKTFKKLVRLSHRPTWVFKVHPVRLSRSSIRFMWADVFSPWIISCVFFFFFKYSSLSTKTKFEKKARLMCFLAIRFVFFYIYYKNKNKKYSFRSEGFFFQLQYHIL